MGIIRCTDKKYLIDFKYLPLGTAFITKECPKENDYVHVETYRGRVLTTRERNYYDDSDFYAVVWDNGKMRDIEYATTRFYTDHCSAKIDATEDVLAEVNAYARERLYNLMQEDNRYLASRVDKGRKVRVIRGRKCPIGTEGTVIFLGDKVSYDYGHTHSRKALIALDDEMERIDCPKHWDKGNCFKCEDKGYIERHKNTRWVADAERNLEVTNPDDYLIPDKDIRERANKGTWATLHSYMGARFSTLVYV